MLTAQLSNFIVYNLLQAHVPYIVFFHCWRDGVTNLEPLNLLQKLTIDNLIFTQFVALRTVNLTEDIEYNYMRHNAPILATYLDMSCADADKFLNACSQQRLYNQHYHWLIYDDAANITHFKQQFCHANLSVDANLFYIHKYNNDVVANSTISYIIYDVHNRGSHIGGQLNMTIDREIHCNVENCMLARYLSKLYMRSKYGNRDSLAGITARVSTVVTTQSLTSTPYELIEFLESKNNVPIDSIARFGFQMMRVYEDMLQFNITFNFRNGWSITDTIGGVVGDLITEDADFASSPFLATDGRLKYITMILETGAFYQVCLFRTPRNAGIRGDVFLKPFGPTVWFIFAGMLTLAGILLWCTFFIESRRMRRRRLPFVPSLLSTLLIAFGTACIQGSTLIPRTTGGRLALFTLLLSSFIMYNYYTSVVVSSLLSSPVKSKIRSLAQLADSSLDVGLEPLPFTRSYLNYSKLPEVHRFIKRKIDGHDPKQIWLPAMEGVQRMRDNPGYVYIFEASSGYVLVENSFLPHEICDLNEVMLRPEKAIYTGLHRNSTYKELMRLKILRSLETGVYQKHRTYWVSAKLRCFANSFIINVGMEYVAPLFFMLLCAYALVLFVLLLEIAWKRYGHNALALIA